MALTRHCWKCGREYQSSGTPGRSEACDCGADLKACVNCASHDLRAAHQCKDRRAEPVEDKRLANYCDWFEFVRREFIPPKQGAYEKSSEEKARDTLKKLLGE